MIYKFTQFIYESSIDISRTFYDTKEYRILFDKYKESDEFLGSYLQDLTDNGFKADFNWSYFTPEDYCLNLHISKKYDIGFGEDKSILNFDRYKKWLDMASEDADIISEFVDVFDQESGFKCYSKELSDTPFVVSDRNGMSSLSGYIKFIKKHNISEITDAFKKYDDSDTDMRKFIHELRSKLSEIGISESDFDKYIITTGDGMDPEDIDEDISIGLLVDDEIVIIGTFDTSTMTGTMSDPDTILDEFNHQMDINGNN
jgi:hypothetical protein